METIILNKKEYLDSGIFKKTHIEEFCNLNIYPLINQLEKEAGLLSDFAEAWDGAYYSIYGNGEDILFLKDNLLQYNNNKNNVIVYCHQDFTDFNKITSADVILAMENTILDVLMFKKIKIHEMDKVLYLNQEAFELFQKHFWYYYDNLQFKYDNLICYTMIIKNGGPLLEQVLTENLPIIDRWCILDTGSTDGSQDVIRRVLKNKKGTLHEEPFVDFKVSRNRCLELAGQSCKFICMLDDTYSIRGDLKNFLTQVRGDQFSDSFSLVIQSEDTEYYSNRIIKSKTGLRYIHRIHEVITDVNNINVTVPVYHAVIFDHRADYMEERTTQRKQFDLYLLFKEVEEFPDDPRALYYIAQTYGCIGDEINKAKYFEQRINHPVQGYFQEKIDACFELARCYNFKVHSTTYKLIEQQPISQEEWEVCERLYLQAFSLDTKRPDSLYFIGIHYYLENNFEKAYFYFKKAFEIGYPINSQYSLKPTLSFHFLPKFLTEMCYKFNDFKTGLEAAHLFLISEKFNKPDGESWNLMSNWYRIHENLCKMGKISEIPQKMDKPIFCIVTDGGWEPWTGSDIETKGLGGSETWIVEMARYISRTEKFNVVVFCKTDKPRFYEHVGYNPIELFHGFIATTEVKYCIISRYTEYIPVAIHGYAENIGVIFHDNLSPEIIIPISPKIKHLWGLTEWHAKQIKQIFPQFNVSSINYGVNECECTSKIKNSFIYSSFPNRGLLILLKMWPKIIKQHPDSTLNIFCDLEHTWSNQVAPEMMHEIKSLLKINTTGVTVHGWVSKKELSIFWATSEYWLYPCIFEETFCLTALEAAISKTCVITNGLAALSETAKYGYTIPGNPLTKEWQESCLKVLFGTMKENGKYNYNIHVNENYKFAKRLTWESQAMKLLNIFI